MTCPPSCATAPSGGGRRATARPDHRSWRLGPLLLPLLLAWALPDRSSAVESGLTMAPTAAPTVAPTARVDAGALASGQRWVLALDVRVLTSGRLGAWVARLAQDEHLAAQLALTSASIGIDPLRDLDALAASGPDAVWTEGVVAASGRFPRSKLETLVHAASGGSITSLGPDRLMTVPHGANGEDLVACLCAGERRLLVASRLPRLAAALAAEGGAGGACRDPGSFPAALSLAPGEAPLLWLAASDFRQWAGLPPRAAPLAQILGVQALVVVSGESLTLRCAAVAVDSATGARLASIIDGGLALAAMDPRVRSDEALQALCDSVELHRRGTRVDLQASVPIALAERCWTESILHPPAQR
jgi:hypothetical protein